MNDLQAVYEGHPGQCHEEHPGGSTVVVDVWAEQYYGVYHTTCAVSPIPFNISLICDLIPSIMNNCNFTQEQV